MKFTCWRAWANLVLLQALFLCVVHGKVTIANKGAGTILVQRGRGFSLTCSSDSDEPLQWYRNGRRVTNGGPQWRLLPFNTPGGARLVLSVRRAADGAAGRYQCSNTANFYDYDHVRVRLPGGPTSLPTVQITQPDGNMTVVGEGGAVTIKCSGNDSAELTWFHKGRPATPSSRVIISYSRDSTESTSTSLLTVLNVRQGDSGHYRCQDKIDTFLRDEIELIVSPANTSRDVLITEPRGDFVRVPKGTKFAMKCEAGGNDMVEWRHGGLSVMPSLSHRITTTRIAAGRAVQSVLIIHNASTTDSGIYTCQDTQDYFNRDHIQVFIINGRKGVEVMITTPLDNETSVKVGGSFTVQCKAGWNALIRWELNGAPVNTTSSVIITPSRDRRERKVSSLLTVMEADSDHVGRFVCRDERDYFNYDDIEILLSPVTSPMTLTIEEPVGNYATVLPDHYLVIRCVGARNTDFRWRHNGIILDVYERPGYVLTSLVDVRRQTVASMLTILNINKWHSGVYTCEDAADYLNSDRIGVRVPSFVNITGGDQTVHLNSGVELHCVADYHTPIEWLFQGTVVNGKTESYSTSLLTDALTGKVTGILRVEAGSDVFGNYTCRDKMTPENSDTVAVRVAVQVERQRRERVEITFPASKEITVREGRSFSMRCQANSGAAVFWSHGGVALLPSSDVRIVTSLTVSGEQITGVTVLTATPDSGGSYVCGDQLDYYNRDEVRVRVQERHPDPITILHPLDDEISLDDGQPFSLICSGPTTTRPAWYHNDHPVGYLPNVIMSSSVDVVTDKLTLILSRLSPAANASGIYTCRDMNNFENADDVRVDVASVSNQPEGLYIEENTALRIARLGKSFTLRCKGERRFRPIWKRNGNRLQSGTNFVIEDVPTDSGVLSVLSVKSATFGHSGNYRCEDERDNVIGQDIAVVVSV